ncbi:hypothetical protein L1987_17118 [Smallanthus sonchifolius]|uniref:Uncharacterized protein n=1 Tax=Smallanthus sonchifolius TaxID=185202 RepID=A0ACB9IY19_9ASTR|nr:hypothetical protein L1987_17118 [Smallanthus sonchifolius]
MTKLGVRVSLWDGDLKDTPILRSLCTSWLKNCSLRVIYHITEELDGRRKKRGKTAGQRKPTPHGVIQRRQRKPTPHQRRPTPNCFLHSLLQVLSVSLRPPSVSLRWVRFRRGVWAKQPDFQVKRIVLMSFMQPCGYTRICRSTFEFPMLSKNPSRGVILRFVALTSKNPSRG